MLKITSWHIYWSTFNLKICANVLEKYCIMYDYELFLCFNIANFKALETAAIKLNSLFDCVFSMEFSYFHIFDSVFFFNNKNTKSPQQTTIPGPIKRSTKNGILNNKNQICQEFNQSSYRYAVYRNWICIYVHTVSAVSHTARKYLHFQLILYHQGSIGWIQLNRYRYKIM